MYDSQIPIAAKFWKLYDRDTVLLFDGDRSPDPVYRLAGVSAFVWRLCDGSHSVGQIVAQSATEYGIGQQQARSNMTSFLQELDSKGLIRWQNHRTTDLRVLLIDPPAVDPAIIGQGAKEPSMGLAYIAAILTNEGLQPSILDLRRKPLEWQHLLNSALEQTRPEVVGITCMSPTFENASQIAYHVKQAAPGARVILGGHHATFMYREVLERNRWIDLVVIGEGEQTMRELVGRLSMGEQIDGVKGIAYRKGGKVVVSPPRDFMTDLDALPFPEPYPITINKEDYSTARILSSRGCPFPCKFCSESGFYNRRIRYRSPENVLDEIEYKYDKYGFRDFMFSDDLFVLDIGRVKKICDGIKSRGLQIKWACNTRVDTAPREIFEAMYDAGCRRLFVGVESADNEILSAMDKRSKVEDIIRGIKMVKSIGLDVSVGFILGFPGETKETANSSLELARELSEQSGIDEIAFTFLNVYPGTDLYNNLEGYGLRYTTGTPEYSLYKPVLETEEFTASDAMESYLDMCYEMKLRTRTENRATSG